METSSKRKEPFGCEKKNMKDPRFHFPKPLVKAVKAGLRRRNVHILGRDELQEIFGLARTGSEKLQRLHLFATLCDAQCEIGRDFAVARFWPKRLGGSQLAGLTRVGKLRLA
jgi:hypothetical protein